MDKMKSIFTKLKTDKADSTLIIFLISIPLVLIVMGFVSDLNKNVNARIVFSTSAQESAQASIRTVDSSGSLNKNTVYAFINEYKRQSNPSTAHTNDIASLKSETCNTVMVDGIERQAPYIKITLGNERGESQPAASTFYTSENFNTSTIDGARPSPGNYKVINAEVYDSSTNDWGIFGLPSCQTHHSTVSAVSFGSNEDI